MGPLPRVVRGGEKVASVKGSGKRAYADPPEVTNNVRICRFGQLDPPRGTRNVCDDRYSPGKRKGGLVLSAQASGRDGGHSVAAPNFVLRQE